MSNTVSGLLSRFKPFKSSYKLMVSALLWALITTTIISTITITATTTAFAQDTSIAALTPEQRKQAFAQQRLYLGVIINNNRTPWVAEFLLRDGELWGIESELKEIGFRTDKLSFDHNGLIPLIQITGLRYRYLSATQEVELFADDALLEPHMIGANNFYHQHRNITSGTGLLINYDVYTQFQENNSTQLGISSEQRLFHNGYLLSNTGYLKHLGSKTKYTRLDTTFTHSKPNSLSTMKAGDMITNGLSWTRSVRLGGLQWSRNFQLRPDLVTFPVPALNGSAAVPSSVELYVNSVRQYSGQVPSGPFVLDNMPALSGAGQATIVVQDEFGREVSTTIPLYIDNRLLRKGLLDYSVELGFLRDDYGQHSFKYGSDLAGSTSLRYGLTDAITLEGHAEATSGLTLAGAGLLVKFGQWGVANASLAASKNDGDTGYMGSLGYQYQSSRYSIDLQGQHLFDDYADLSTRAGALFPRELYRATLGLPLNGKSSLSLSYIDLKNGSGERSRLGTMTYSLNLSSKVSLNFNAYQDFSNKRTKGAMLSLNILLGGSTTATFSGGHTDHQNQYSASISRPPDYDGGWGWRAYGSRNGDINRTLGELRYRGRYGDALAAVEQVDNTSSLTLQASGALVVMDGTVLPSRYIPQSFALVSTNGIKDVPVLMENRLIGTSNKNGHYLIPDLLAYYPNKISIDSLNLPANSRVKATYQYILPAFQSGALIQFNIESYQGGQFILVDEKNEFLPVGTPVTLLGSGAQAVVGFDGMVFFEALEATNTVRADLLSGASCLAEVSRPTNATTSIPQLGRIICHMEKTP